MELFIGFTIIWLFLGVLIASAIVKMHHWKMLFSSVALTMYGGGIAIASSHDGELLGSTGMYFSGQILLLFFSVLGGALASIALSEIRKVHLEKSANK